VSEQTTIEFVHEMCRNAEMDWDDLRYVLALSRQRTLSLAASDLSVSHTTVGRRLRTIEEALGVRLFDRTPDEYTPTPAGQDIIEVAERMESELHALAGRVAGRDSRLSGSLRVSTMDMLFRRYHATFASFTQRYPSVELTLSSTDTEVSLLKREADVALRLTNTPPEYVVGRKVGRAEFAVFASKRLVERIGAGESYEAFPWIHWDTRLNMRWLDEWLAAHAPGARIAMRIDVSSLVLRDVIAAGIGVHFLSCDEGDADPELVRIGPTEPAFGRDVWLLTLPELRHASRVRAFMDHVEDSLRTPPSIAR